MKISPIEIRQHTFEKVFRGYNIDEVNAFLNSLSQEWEKVSSDNKMMKMQLEIAEKELSKLRDIEHTLFRTLKTAEDTSSQITDQANKEAENYVNEAQQKADRLILEATQKAEFLVKEAEEQYKSIHEEAEEEIKNQERDLRAMEKYRDNLIVQLKSLVNSTGEALEHFEKKFDIGSFQARIREVKTTPKPVEEEEMPANQTVLFSEEPEVAESVAEPVAESVVEEAAVAPQAELPEEVDGEPFTEPLSAAEPDPIVETEIPAAAQEEEVQNASPDAASEALAEAERTARAVREAAESIRRSEARTVTPEPAREEPKPSGGSFFDQIS
jgi:cell division initiation protein